MPVSRETVAELFRQIQAVGRSMKAVAGREPYGGLRLSTVILRLREPLRHRPEG